MSGVNPRLMIHHPPSTAWASFPCLCRFWLTNWGNRCILWSVMFQPNKKKTDSVSVYIYCTHWSLYLKRLYLLPWTSWVILSDGAPSSVTGIYKKKTVPSTRTAHTSMPLSCQHHCCAQNSQLPKSYMVNSGPVWPETHLSWMEGGQQIVQQYMATVCVCTLI